MLKKIRINIKKLQISPNLVISIFALLMSVLSVYFQFFNIKHSVLYSILYPELKGETKEIIIPILFKNTGNQVEVILDSELQLEVKETEEFFFKRISPNKNKGAYFILAPGENKTIYLVGNYKDYFFGTLKINYPDTTDFKYVPITIFDNLILKVSINYLTARGKMAKEEREVGDITFDQNENISLMNCNPIELKKLNLRYNDSEIISHTIVPNYSINGRIHIDFNDSLSIEENIDKIQLLNRIYKEQIEK